MDRATLPLGNHPERCCSACSHLGWADWSAKLRFVFGTLLHEGRLTEEHLTGLSEDKVREFRSYANFLRTVDEPVEMMVAGRRSGDGQ
jgi:hypothetical protein